MGNKVVYEPNQYAKIGFFKTMLVIIKNTIASKELIFQLYKRDFLMQYKKSFLGLGWMIFGPIMGVVSWVLMDSAGVLSPGDVGVPYPVYVLFGTSIWGLFMSFFSSTSQTLQIAAGFIQQVNFHHEALVFKQGLQNLTNFGISLIINIVVMLSFGVTPTWFIVLVPLFIIPIFFLAASAGLMVSILSTLTSDVSRIASFFLSLLMFITPVIYDSSEKVLWLQQCNLYNPLTYLITAPRDLILTGTMSNPFYYIVSIVMAILLFMVALRFFYISEKKVIEKMI
ncbi:ABC transporter permease [Flavobacteriaceae bacterium]|nr:ABC transporter permease [Flavobacteriaceae bacterium]